MRVTTNREDYRINGAALAMFMDHQDETLRSLAEKVGCSHGTIDNMIKGRVRTCPKARAKKIERILLAPNGMIFTPELSTVTRDVPPRKVPA